MDSRLPPPQGAPPSYAFVTRVYRRNLRPVVIIIAFLGGLWTLLSAIGFFRTAGFDKSQNIPKLVPIAIALGALYMAVTLIELFGLIAAAGQKITFVRIYALLSVFAALVVFAAGLIRVIVHFIFKNDIINTCTSSNTGDTIVYFGFWGPTSSSTLTAAQANQWCHDSYNRDSWSEIVAFLVTSVLAAFFTAIAFSYYRQLLDPSSPANAARAPSNQVRMGAFPSHYNPPYNGPGGYGYNVPYSGQPYAGQPNFPQSGYAPPPGPPPRNRDEAFVPPYDGEGKPPGYVPGDGKFGYGLQDDKDDPFADEGPSSREEHDVTSRPAPGGYETFRR